jgi:hypothetical protein
VSVNNAPVAIDHAHTMNEDAVLTVAAPGVLQGATDLDGAPPGTAVLVSTVQHGTLALAADGGFVYTPNTNYVGTDSFTYKAKDSENAESALATVTFTISALHMLHACPACKHAVMSLSRLTHQTANSSHQTARKRRPRGAADRSSV